MLVSKPASMSLSPPNSYGGRKLAPANGPLASIYIYAVTCTHRHTYTQINVTDISNLYVEGLALSTAEYNLVSQVVLLQM